MMRVIVCTLGLLAGQAIEAESLIRLDGLHGRTYIGENLEEFEDRGGTLTLDLIKHREFQAAGSPTIHHGFTDSVWWFRFSYDSAGIQEDQAFFLSMFNFRMYDAAIFIEADGVLIKQLQSGMIGRREVSTTDIVFRLPRAKDKATVYLRVRGITPIRFAPSILSERQLRNSQLTSDMLIGLAMGGQFSLAVFNLVLFASIRDRSYLSYSLFQIFTVLLVLNSSGYTYEWFLTEYPMQDLALTAPLGMITSIAIILFTADFLHIRAGRPRTFIRFLVIALAACALLSPALPLQVAIRYSAYVAVAVCVTVFWLAVTRYRAGFGPARFFFVAFLPLLGFAFMFMISRFLTSIKTGPFSLHIFASGLPLAIVMSSMLFSVALSDRFQTMRNALRKTVAAREEMRHQNEQALREEKNRINRELHDVIGSDLSALIFELQKSDQGTSVVGRLRRMLSRLRDLVHLNALDPGFDVSREIRSFLAELEMPGLQVQSSIDDTALPVITAFHVHRIFLESVSNCLRHADASILTVLLKKGRAGRTRLIVADNGRGFDSRKAANGINGIRERARTIGARVRLVSRPGTGTLLVLHTQDAAGAFLPLDRSPVVQYE